MNEFPLGDSENRNGEFSNVENDFLVNMLNDDTV